MIITALAGKAFCCGLTVTARWWCCGSEPQAEKESEVNEPIQNGIFLNFGVTPEFFIYFFFTEKRVLDINLDSEDFHLEAVYRHRTCWCLYVFGVSSHPNMYCNLKVVFLLAHKRLISCRVAETFIRVHMVTWWRAGKCMTNVKHISRVLALGMNITWLFWG